VSDVTLAALYERREIYLRIVYAPAFASVNVVQRVSARYRLEMVEQAIARLETLTSSEAAL
jgi:hypothetical protein